MRTRVPTDVACPTWCRTRHGHPYEPDGPDELTRGHSGSLGGSVELGLAVEAFALEIMTRDGEVTVLAPTISVHLTGDDERSPADLRKLAALLLNAADRADVELGIA